jgi:hypothetical protein
MSPTFRIREDVARATAAFLVQAKSVEAETFAGSLTRSILESPTTSRWSAGPGHHVIMWESRTAHQIIDDLLLLKEKSGGSISLHGLTLSYVILEWDNLILNAERTRA